MNDLFGTAKQPLAERLRPQTLDTYLGQEHIIGNNSALRQSINAGFLPSLILWGPPGVGKTTLALLIAKTLQKPFHTLSAVSSGVKDVREVLSKAQRQYSPILFIDEIHRFSKSQQDSLLGAVEKGTVILIGATTENPSFEVISALLSRCQIYTLKPLSKEQLLFLIDKGITQLKKDTGKNIKMIENNALLQASSGDGRKLLNILEFAVQKQANGNEITITNQHIIETIQHTAIKYDKNGESHYDIISAYIKSIRGSDPNAAVYWLARMVEGGEEPKYIARRLLILASEDIGNANPTAMVMANNCFQAVQAIGWPESRIILSQTTIYLALSPKSNSAYTAISEAQKLVKQTQNLPVPLHLRNAPTELMKNLNYGKNYKYAHNYDNNFVIQDFLPDEIQNTILYTPENNPKEQDYKNKLKKIWHKKYNY